MIKFDLKHIAKHEEKKDTCHVLDEIPAQYHNRKACECQDCKVFRHYENKMKEDGLDYIHINGNKHLPYLIGKVIN